MSARLEQINLSYNTNEDRLLLKVRNSSGEEYRLWMTRRFTGLLWQVVGRIIRETDWEIDLDGITNPEEVLAFEHQRAVHDGDFKTPYDDKSAASYPLGEDGVLGFRISYENGENGVMLNLTPEDGQGIRLGLDRRMLHNLCKLVADAVRGAGWNLELGKLGEAGEDTGPRVIN